MPREFPQMPGFAKAFFILGCLTASSCMGTDSGATDRGNGTTSFVAPPYELTEDAFTIQGDLGPFEAVTHLQEVEDH